MTHCHIKYKILNNKKIYKLCDLTKFMDTIINKYYKIFNFNFVLSQILVIF